MTHSTIFVSAAACLLLLAGNVEAEETWDDVWKGLEGSFALPVGEWLEDVQDKGLLEQLADPWKVDAGLTAAKNDKGSYTPIANAAVKFTPLGFWFAEANFFHYLEKSERKQWDPDFVYRFGCEDWRPYALSLVYSNYSGNRSSSDIVEKYDQGTYTLTWNLPLSGELARPFLIETDKTIGCKANILHAPKYVDQDGQLQHDQTRLSLSFDAPIYEGWYLSFNLFYYMDSSQQQPWSPDYTFEFGYRNESFTIAYKNYRGNRFPWHDDMPHDGGFAEGGIGITWHW